MNSRLPDTLFDLEANKTVNIDAQKTIDKSIKKDKTPNSIPTPPIFRFGSKKKVSFIIRNQKKIRCLP